LAYRRVEVSTLLLANEVIYYFVFHYLKRQPKELNYCSNMRCPHCSVVIHDTPVCYPIGYDITGLYEIRSITCPNCHKFILYLANYNHELCIVEDGNEEMIKKTYSVALIYPQIINRQQVAAEVPIEFAKDFTEACLVISLSPKASAALSRRCLQNIIRKHLKIEKKDLSQEIQEVINRGLFPTDILENIDYIRNIGNFAAHPIKSISSGEIVEVEPNEAEWNLDVLEMVFDYLFVRPAFVKAKRSALNKKLGDAGKPEMK
jgi:hypothetical protein